MSGSRGARVLVVRPDNDGDVLLAGPAIRALASSAGELTLLCGPRGRAAAALLPGVDRVLVHRLAWIDPEPEPLSRKGTLGLVDELAALGLDEALVLTSFHQSALPTALLLKLAGVPTVAATSEDYPGSLLDVRHRIGGDVHEVERSLSLAATLGYELPAGDDGALRVELPSGTRDSAGGLLEEAAIAEPFVVVHPGASVPARAWGPHRHAELVEALAEAGWNVVVTGSPTESGLTSHVAGPRRAGVADLGGRTTLAVLAALLSRATAIVVGNTGPAHLAAAVGTPVVSLYAPTVPAVRWRPWRVPHVLLGDQAIECAGCRARVCPREGHPCLGEVGVDDVLTALADLDGHSGRRAELAAMAGVDA